jgi:hypothetical protein
MGLVVQLYNRLEAMAWKEEHPGFISLLSSLE